MANLETMRRYARPRIVEASSPNPRRNRHTVCADSSRRFLRPQHCFRFLKVSLVFESRPTKRA